ncbi:MAG TPA: DUF4340 domain-containing protein, partial [Candidatus Acidoferrales bacterium]|nr:DUF4340 domain-containing protein [Candidatus Acidoferrales bacterium]
NKTSIDKSLNDLRDKRFLTADFDKVSQIDLTAKKQQIEFQHSKDAWQIVKPVPARADGSQVDDLVQKLRTAKFDIASGDDAKKAASAFAAGTPFSDVKIVGASGTQDLQIRKNKDDYYARSSVAEGAYKVANDLATALDKSLDDFRNKKLFDFGFDDPNKIEFRDGSKSTTLTHTGADWFQDGKKLDPAGVDNFVEKIRNLAAVKFPDSGFGSAEIDLNITSNDSKRVEKISISKNGDRYIAKRENEPELYELNATDVSDLQKAVADVKPVPPAPAKH